ncbi:MAG: hypothetical protein Tsb0010_08270 [Parvularculaceae bacterium]
MRAPIKVAATILLWTVPLIVAATLFYLLVYWGAGIAKIGGEELVLGERPPRAGYAWFGFAVDVPVAAVWLYALYRLQLLLLRVRKGLALDGQTARHLRAYASFAALTVFLHIATSGARRWAQGEHDMPFWTHIQISMEHAGTLFTAAIFILLSHIIVEAESYKREAEDYL